MFYQILNSKPFDIFDKQESCLNPNVFVYPAEISDSSCLSAFQNHIDIGSSSGKAIIRPHHPHRDVSWESRANAKCIFDAYGQKIARCGQINCERTVRERARHSHKHIKHTLCVTWEELEVGRAVRKSEFMAMPSSLLDAKVWGLGVQARIGQRGVPLTLKDLCLNI
ncbi:hypothetical protein WA026_000932 [Henosepilachna vigintioctopunctata]|uniref:Uncharacterized protein n=1 Tax=Henosepilachna vigintioctopunctata TaxID=420089 RepID=A0AAW1V5S4_9CUCU